MHGLLELLPKPNSEKSGWPWTEETSVGIYNAGVEYPKISIVTASFNQGEYIEETIRSVLLQNYPNLEYIIIDGGSTDNSVEIIKKYEKWISYWVSEKDRGQSHAINKGVERTSGAVFNWLNSDDYYAVGALATIGKTFMEENPLVVAAQSNIFGGGKDWISSTPVGSDFLMFSNARIDQPATFWDLNIFKSLGCLNEKQHLTMDAEHWFKFLLCFDRSHISEKQQVVVNFREHIDSKTVNNRSIMVFERMKLYNTILSTIKGEKTVFSEYIEKCDPKRLQEIRKGMLDFKLYWTKKYIFKYPINTIKCL